VLTEKEIGQVLAAQLMSIVRNGDQSYVSSADIKFSHLRDSGKKIMSELTELMFIKAAEYEKQRRQTEAEQLIMDNLKK
jgi:hypothetical protein